MKKPIIAIWNLLFRLSLIYYALFLLLMILGVYGYMDRIFPAKDLQSSIREFFSFGMILFWIYLTSIPLGLTGILRIEKKAFVTMIVLVALTAILFILSEHG